MGLPNILLSLLRAPMSGTDLIALFRGSFQHFWTTDLSQIYRALEALEREGCVTSKSRPSGRGPAKRVFRLTAKGRRRLQRWIDRDPVIPGAKFEYLAQVFSLPAAERPAERAREMLESMRDEAVRAVRVLEAIGEQYRKVPGFPEAMPTELFYPWLTLRHGLLRRRALLDWVEESLTMLDRRPSRVELETEGGPSFVEVVEQFQRVSELIDPAGESIGQAVGDRADKAEF